MNNLKSILKISFTTLLVVVLSAFAVDTASAKTLSSSNTMLDESTIDYFNDIYDRENYSYMVYASEYVNTSGYNYTTYYYLCLTNEKVNTSDTLNVNVVCDELYQYSKNNNSYVVNKLDDTDFIVNNSIYYYRESNYFKECILVIISIICSAFFLYTVIVDLF